MDAFQKIKNLITYVGTLHVLDQIISNLLRMPRISGVGCEGDPTRGLNVPMGMPSPSRDLADLVDLQGIVGTTNPVANWLEWWCLNGPGELATALVSWMALLTPSPRRCRRMTTGGKRKSR